MTATPRTPKRRLIRHGHNVPPRKVFAVSVPDDPFWEGKRLTAETVWDNDCKVPPRRDEWPAGTVFRLYDGGRHVATFVMDARRGMVTTALEAKI